MDHLDLWSIHNSTPSAQALAQWNSVATTANGYLGLRGNLCEDRAADCPVTLVNGVFDVVDAFGLLRPSNEAHPELDPSYFDSAGPSPAIANLPNPLFVQTFIDEQELTLQRGGVSEFLQTLDLRNGLYRYRFDYRDGWGRTTRVEVERFASLVHAHRVHMRCTLTPLDHDDTPIRIESGIDGQAYSNPTKERQFQVAQRWAEPAECCRVVAVTNARRHEVRLGVAHVLRRGSTARPAARVAGNDSICTRYEFLARRGQPLILERAIVITASEDARHGCIADFDAELAAAMGAGFEAALAEHRAAWKVLWNRCDVQVDGDDPAQLGLRFAIHHLLASAPRFSDRLSAPAKLLTGEYYQGGVFYDTDLFITPFYALTQPELARSCVRFRYEGLRPARETARNLGHDGAKLAWQAGPNGEECLGRWYRFTYTNIHVNAAAVVALLRYVWVTGDRQFLYEYGIDLLVETARFLTSRATHDDARNAMTYQDVCGPDTGHCPSHGNAYTEQLAKRCLAWAADALDAFARDFPDECAEAARQLGVKRDEPARWRAVADQIRPPVDDASRIIPQCDGYFEMKPPPPLLFDQKQRWYAPVAGTQAIHQPDVVALLALLRDAFDVDTRRANWRYYRERCLNYASISYASNAIVAADVGELELGYDAFVRCIGMDLDEGLTGRHDTFAGLHGTALGGGWCAAIFGFAGLHLDERGIRLRPNLPPLWNAIRFTLTLLGVGVAFEITRDTVTIDVGRERRLDLAIDVAGTPVRLKSGERIATPYA